MAQGESIYDMDWYPASSCADPASCCFASTSRGHPVHLWDVAQCRVRTSYRTHDNADEVTAAYCLRFHPDCERLVGGLRKRIVLWELSRPGREYMSIGTESAVGRQTGIVSSVDVSPQGDLIAAGSFNKDVAVYDSRSGDMAMLFHGHIGGVTHVRFSRCGYFVYSGARQDAAIHCWDVRAGCSCVYSLRRDDALQSNQRISFDIEPCGRHLLVGTTGGMLQAFDLTDGTKCGQTQVAADTVGAVSIHPFVPLVATASGHRRFGDGDGSDSESDGGKRMPRPLLPTENRLAIWAVGSSVLEADEDRAEPQLEPVADADL